MAVGGGHHRAAGADLVEHRSGAGMEALPLSQRQNRASGSRSANAASSSSRKATESGKPLASMATSTGPDVTSTASS